MPVTDTSNNMLEVQQNTIKGACSDYIQVLFSTLHRGPLSKQSNSEFSVKWLKWVSHQLQNVYNTVP